MTNNGQQKPSGNITGALILITIGVVLLLGNLGVLSSIDVFSFVRGLTQYWPVVLIAVGVNMITAGRFKWWILGGTIALGFVLAEVGSNGRAAEHAVTYPANNLPLELRIDLGVDNLNLSPGRGSGDLVHANVEMAPSMNLEADHRVQAGRNIVRLGTQSRSLFSLPFGSKQVGTWQVLVNQVVPLDLIVDAGVGNSELDLVGTNLEHLDFNAGVGNVHIALPRHTTYRAAIDGGVGQLTLVVDPTSPIIIRVDTGIGSVRIPTSFRQEGRVYYSPGYEPGLAASEITIDAGIGAIHVRESDVRSF